MQEEIDFNTSKMSSLLPRAEYKCKLQHAQWIYKYDTGPKAGQPLDKSRFMQMIFVITEGDYRGRLVNISFVLPWSNTLNWPRTIHKMHELVKLLGGVWDIDQKDKPENSRKDDFQMLGIAFNLNKPEVRNKGIVCLLEENKPEGSTKAYANLVYFKAVETKAEEESTTKIEKDITITTDGVGNQDNQPF